MEMGAVTYEKPRRDKRHAVTLPALITCDSRTHMSVTENVSLQGMRVRTCAMPMVRQGLRIDIYVPWLGTSLTLRGTTAYAAVDHETRDLMLGIDLSLAESKVASEWARVVEGVEHGSADAQAFQCAARATCIQPLALTELAAVRGRGRSLSRLRISVSSHLQRDELLHLLLRHPVSGLLFPLRARVLRTNKSNHRYEATVEVARLRSHEYKHFVSFCESTDNARKRADDGCLTPPSDLAVPPSSAHALGPLGLSQTPTRNAREAADSSRPLLSSPADDRRAWRQGRGT